MARGQIQIEGLNDLTRSFGTFPKEVRQNINNAGRKIAKEVIVQSRRTAAGQGKLSKMAAEGLVTGSGRVPNIKYGGTAILRTKKNGQVVRRKDVIFGAIFGSTQYKQFPPRSPKSGRGNEGYFLYPDIQRMRGYIQKQYLEAVDGAIRRVVSGG